MANRNRHGGSFDDVTIEAVWAKGRVIAALNPNIWRRDCCGRWMRRDRHGSRASAFGWEIDHIKPVSRCGPTEDADRLANLQPLQWQNNASKGDNYPWSCS